jgi:hypothetical protein
MAVDKRWKFNSLKSGLTMFNQESEEGTPHYLLLRSSFYFVSLMSKHSPQQIFSDAFSLCFSQRVRDEVSRP